MSVDEDQYGDPHGECAHEIHTLQSQLAEALKRNAVLTEALQWEKLAILDFVVMLSRFKHTHEHDLLLQCGDRIDKALSGEPTKVGSQSTD